MAFEWTDSDRAKVVPGATVCVSGSSNYESGRYAITSAIGGFLIVTVNGVDASVPFYRADPSTLNVPESRQTELFK